VKYMYRTILCTGASITHKSMIHIAYSPYYTKMTKFINSPYFRSIYVFCLIYVFDFPLFFNHDAFMHHSLHVLDASDCDPVKNGILSERISFQKRILPFTLAIRLH